MSKSILELSKYVNVLVSVCIQKNNKYLLIEEAKKEVVGLWNFPTGKVHENEGLIEGAQREFLEETGLECEITDLMSIYYFNWEDMPGITIRFNFWGKTTTDIPKKLAPDVSDTKWFTIEELNNLKQLKKLRSKTTEKQLDDIKSNNRYSLNLLETP